MKSQNNNDKGNFLEDVYYMFEKSLERSLDKVMQKKIKLPDQHGILREIDIYIEYKVDSLKKAKYAIECKNYKRKVTLKDIVDFYSKIDGTDRQGIFVCTSSYQKGAIKKAKSVGITIYKFATRQNSEKGIRNAWFFQKRFNIQKIAIHSNAVNGSNEKINRLLSDVEQMNKIITSTLRPAISDQLPILLPQLYPTWDTIGEIGTHVGLENAKPVAMGIEMKEGFAMTLDNEQIEVLGFTCYLLVWEQHTIKQNAFPHSMQLIEHGNNDILATISPATFSFENFELMGTMINLKGESTTKLGIADMRNLDSSVFYDATTPIHIQDTPLKVLLK